MGVAGSLTAVPMRNSRKPRLMLLAASTWPSRYSSGSRTSMMTGGVSDFSRRATSSGPSSGTTCRASASISLSVFMAAILPPFPVDIQSDAVGLGASRRRGVTAILAKIHGEYHERHHSGRGLRDAALSRHAGAEQAARSHLQQADDLL